MTKLLGSLVLVLAVAAGLALQQNSPATTLKLDVNFSPFNLLDFGDKGPTVGDQTLFDDELLKDGKVIGLDEGFCVITRARRTDPNPLLAECLATFVLPDGQITAQGRTSDAPKKELAITGGTGAYVGAKGRLTLEEFGNGKGSVTFELSK